MFSTDNIVYYHRRVNPLTAKLLNLNFHPLDIVSR